MTSRNSFISGMKENRKRRVWTIVLFVFLCFLLTIAFEMLVENLMYQYQTHAMTYSELQEQIAAMLGGNVIPYYLFLAGIGAALFGFQGFGWLMVKQKVDFYHSLPVTRTRRFFTIYLNGIVFFYLPFAIHTGVVALLIGMRGLLTTLVVKNIMVNLLVYLLAFLLLYHIVIVAVMMTGNLIVSILASGTFFLYVSGVRILMEGMFTDSFRTFAPSKTRVCGWLSFFSPCETLLNYMQAVFYDSRLMTKYLMCLILQIGIGLVIGLWLYRIRPSEHAGKALIFKKTATPIRLLLVIPLAIVTGYFFSMMTGMNATAWLYLGCFIGVCFFHGFMEVIFHFNIKAAFRKKGELVGTIAVTLLILSIFRFDLLHYDDYLPEKDQIQTISYSMELEQDSYHFVNTRIKIGEKDEIDLNNSELFPSSFQLKASKTEKIDQIYEVLKAYQSQPGKKTEETGKNLLICYELQNGKRVYRQYPMSKEFLEKEFAPVYESEQGKKTIYPILWWDGNRVREVNCVTPFFNQTVSLTKEEMIKLLQVYQSDIQKRTFEQCMNQKGIGSLQFHTSKTEREGKGMVQVTVMDSDLQTIGYLQSKGIDMTFPNDQYEILGMQLVNLIGTEYESSFWNGENKVELTKKQQEEILPYLVSNEYIIYDTLNSKNYNYRADIMVKNKETGVVSQAEYNLAEEDIPEFMKE